MSAGAREPASFRRRAGLLRGALRLSLVAMVAATVLFHFRAKEPAAAVSVDPYRKAESILEARGFASDASTPSLGLATRLVRYSSEECPQGVGVAVLSYDQLRIVLERISPDSATPYLVVAPRWEKGRLERAGLFFAGMTCRLREPIGSTVGECEKYLYVTYLPGCLHEADWHDFWRRP